jgi:hypothetical protein
MNVYINVKLSGRRLRAAIFCPSDDLEFRSSMTVFEAVGGVAAFGEAVERLHQGTCDEPALRVFASQKHLIAEHPIDQTDLLNSVGGCNEAFTLPAGRGDEARHPGGADPRGALPIKKVRDIYISNLHMDTLPLRRNFW